MLEHLKAEMMAKDYSTYVNINNLLIAAGYRAHYTDGVVLARGYATAAVFRNHEKHIYENDRIVGSIQGQHAPKEKYTIEERDYAKRIEDSYGRRVFPTNADHYAADFETPLSIGVGGLMKKIEAAMEKHTGDAEKIEFLQSAHVSMQGFSDMIRGYGEAAEKKAGEVTEAAQKHNLLTAAAVCRKIALDAPETFHEAVQLVWLIHISFCYERRFAMALGRLDQYLYPFFERDIAAGRLTKEEATDLLAHMFYKIQERRIFPEEPRSHGSDVVNIAIAGRTREGKSAVNALTYCVVDAVRACNIPGPNLSARMHSEIPDDLWDNCLALIGTGLGYPALMNDDINIASLKRCGYDEADCNDYSMVGCIENFMTGKQPPWSDGRFDSPKYLEYALGNGRCLQTGVLRGIETGPLEEIDSMEALMEAVEKQMEFGAAEYVALFENGNMRYNAKRYTQPYLSCYCHDCIDRGLDINCGGAFYPSTHGIGCMGIATVADSLAAIEKVVFTDKTVTLSELYEAMRRNFEGYEELRQILLKAPKYGNNDEFVDKYALWFVEVHFRIFSKYRTPDGGWYMPGMASNVNNISAGKLLGATPDGRKNGEPMSDAASPMYGMDKMGVTSSLLSVSKPDYTKSFGMVLNQKFSPAMFATKENRDKIKALIKVYFERGGQEVQINAISREILGDAMENPEKYRSLVTRVSGFSAFYTSLRKDIQEDILNRTEHSNV